MTRHGKPEGVRFVTALEPGSKTRPWRGGILIVHPDHPPRWVSSDGRMKASLITRDLGRRTYEVTDGRVSWRVIHDVVTRHWRIVNAKGHEVQLFGRLGLRLWAAAEACEEAEGL